MRYCHPAAEAAFVQPAKPLARLPVRVRSLRSSRSANSAAWSGQFAKPGVLPSEMQALFPYLCLVSTDSAEPAFHPRNDAIRPPERAHSVGVDRTIQDPGDQSCATFLFNIGEFPQARLAP